MNLTFEILLKGSGGSYTWSEFGKLVSPTKIGIVLKNETATAYQISLYMKGANASLESLVPGTICRANFGTKIIQFVVIDGGKVDQNAVSTFAKHNYTIQHAINFFRETYIQTSYFTAGRYTLAQFITRLLALTTCDFPISLSTSGAYSTMVANWLSPSFQVASNAFLDNLIKLGNLLQVRIDALFVITSGQVSIQLISSSLKGNVTIESFNGRFVGSSEEYKGATFASKVVADVSNMKTEQTLWFPMDNMIVGQLPEPDGDNNEINSDNAVLNIGYPINQAFKVRAMGFGVVITDSNVAEGAEDYRYTDVYGNEIVADPGKFCFYKDDVLNRKTVYQSTELNVVEYGEWLMLDPDSTLGATAHQQNTLYYKEGENKIYNIKIFEGNTTATTIYRRDVWQSGSISQTTYKHQRLRYHLNYYNALVSLSTNAIVVSSNTKNSQRVTHYSQDENLASGKALMQNMNGHIDSMMNVEKSKTYDFDSIDDVPVAGNKYNGFVISQIMMQIDNKRIRASFSLSDELVAKSEYVNADAGLLLPAIPFNKAYDRKTNYRTQLWLCSTLAQAQAIKAQYGADTYFRDADYALKLFEAFANGRFLYPSSPAEMRLRVGDASDDYLYTAMPINVAVVENNMILSVKVDHPSVVGKLVDTTLGTTPANVRYYPVAYVDEVNAMARNFYFKFGEALGFVAHAGDTYPRITSTTFNATGIALINDTDYYHDASERLNVSYQLTLRNPTSFGKITQAFLEESGFIKDTRSISDAYTRRIAIGSLFDFEIGLVTVTLAEAKIRSVKIHFADTSLVVGTIYNIRIYRKQGGAEEDMVITNGRIGSVAGTLQRYIEIFVAITK